ncbi:MAG: zf-TFIIB domain-containing protein [Nitrospiraceae bacterium]|nr:MAG: zf-TFIIB domain-containing protein [Nitrospiraceae bacterium]
MSTGVEKQTKLCEHCEKDINIKYDVCPICGGHQSESQSSIHPECPRCGIELQLFISNDEEYDICPECGGMWLDKDEFYRATRERDVYKSVTTKSEYRRVPIRGPIEYVPCVRCAKLMNRGNFGKISGVIIDRCSKHGVWLEAGELEKIQHFIADGGLDTSRDKEITKNRQLIKDLATQVNQNSFTQRLLHFWNLKRVMFRGWRK